MKALTKASPAKVASGRDGHRRVSAAEAAPDRIERVSREQTRWDTVLVWFMRVVALAWLAKGLASWAAILDMWPGAPPFESEPFGRQAAIVYFAVIDFTAAVGLWLTSAWGGVVWLLAATSAITLAVLTPLFLPLPMPLTASVGAVILAYFVLSYLAAREAQ